MLTLDQTSPKFKSTVRKQQTSCGGRSNSEKVVVPVLKMAPMSPMTDNEIVKKQCVDAAPPTSSVKSVPTKRTPNDFIFGKMIGEGSFSTVYLARDIHTHNEFAIKVCDKQHIIREKKAEYVKREKDVLFLLSNTPFVVKLFYTFQDVERLYFVLSYAKNGELLPYINKVGSFDLECTRFYSSEILVALEHFRRLNIIHRDLKPENILLDENMHIMITDFGSSKILTPAVPAADGAAAVGSNGTDASHHNGNLTSSTMSSSTSDEVDGVSHQQRRRNSFVGTAQYVSPELLLDKTVSPASDLWAFGCIIYQMISGLPPFRSRSEYIIFQKIAKLEYEVPNGFCPVAKDLVQKLLVIEPEDRVGFKDAAKYTSIRSHKFYEGVNFDTLHQTSPPPIYPYLPGNSSDNQELRSQYRVPGNLEPGLDDRQLTRLLGLDIRLPQPTVPVIPRPRKRSGVMDLTAEEIKEQLEKQQSENKKWNAVVEGNLILKQGLVDKRKGLFSRRRMLLLTMGPHLYYADPGTYVLKGQIPWSPELRVEPKNFKIFFVHTPNRTYYLEDPDGYALEWCKVIEEVRVKTYGAT